MQAAVIDRQRDLERPKNVKNALKDTILARALKKASQVASMDQDEIVKWGSCRVSNDNGLSIEWNWFGDQRPRPPKGCASQVFMELWRAGGMGNRTSSRWRRE